MGETQLLESVLLGLTLTKCVLLLEIYHAT